MDGMNRPVHWIALAIAAVASLPAAAHDDGYVRAGFGVDASANARFADVHCARTDPPALFGCVAGNDGRALGARGDFGRALALDAGLGRRFSPRWRGEVLLGGHPQMRFHGNANFLGVSGAQPVDARVRSLALFAVGWFDVPATGRWQPFVGVGVGVARNRLGTMAYGFPGLAPGAATRVHGGNRTGFAWLASAGVAVALTDRLHLDLAWRYTDLGEVRTDSGSATIIRSSGNHRLDIAATRAPLRTRGLLASLRYRF
jgi:opacity protein-like surface antigen